jgi:hypothetical protein
MNDILEMAKNYIQGNVSGEFSTAQTSEALRQALIKLNGDSTKLNPKTFIRGTELFSTVESIIEVATDEGLKDDDTLFNKLVEYKNIAEGDVNEFYTDGDVYFVVADAAKGIKGVRRQRLDNSQTVVVNTSSKTVRVYEALSRLLAGRIDFNKFIDSVVKGFKQKVLADAQAAIDSITASTVGMKADLVVNGTYDEDKLLELIEKVEAATGKKAVIYGTKTALRKITTAVVSDQAKEDIYNMGYYGKIAGTDLIALRQSFKPGTRQFNLSNNKIYIIAGDEKPVKVVNEGEGWLSDKEATENNDLTKEYAYSQSFGTGVLVSQDIALYTFA